MINRYFAKDLRGIGHSLDKATDLLLKIKSRDDDRLNDLLNDQIIIMRFSEV